MALCQAAGMILSSRIINHEEVSMISMYYIGLDIHKKYFSQLLKNVEYVPESVLNMLR